MQIVNRLSFKIPCIPISSIKLILDLQENIQYAYTTLHRCIKV